MDLILLSDGFKVCGSQKKSPSDTSPSVCWPNRFFCSVHYSVSCSSAFLTQWWCHCNLHEKFLPQSSHSSLCNVSVLESIANLVINYPWRIASVQQMYPGRSRGLWEQPVFVANQDERWCSWCSWNDTRSLSGETFPEVSHRERNQTRRPRWEQADSYTSRDSRQRVIVRESSWMWGCVCVFGWLRNENGWKCVSLFIFLHTWCESSRSRWKGHTAAEDQIRIQDQHLNLPELQTLVWQKLTNSSVARALAITLTSPPLTLRGHRVTC